MTPDIHNSPMRYLGLWSPEIMEHVDPTVSKKFDVRSGCPCQFCEQFDPAFYSRKPIDQMVLANRQNTAGAHFTEDGYVRHRMVELSGLVSRKSLAAA